jgi:NADH:ubiquinone oxidoreductase subunit 4 (subunit M)
MFAGLFLAVTLLPLTPFHQPFVLIVSSAQGTLPAFWVVGWLALGLAELHKLQASLPADVLSIFQILAFGSALYASLKCLGQNHIRLFLAYATIAQVALLWGLANVFSNFSQWGMQFGIAVALVMSGLFLAFSFVQHRYGWHPLGTLPGLASPMPRLGTMFVFLITIAILLPILPTLSGLVSLPTIEHHDKSLLPIFLMFLTIWLLGSWYFSNLLHQTAFGKARPDIPYTDLRRAEIFSVALLILGASYSGLVY